MKIILCFISAVLMMETAHSQTPILDSWMMNSAGELGQYDLGNGLVNMNDSVDVLQVCYDANNIYVRSEGLGNYVMGPFNGNPNSPSAQSNIFKFPKTAQEETGAKIDQPSVGALGVSLNGIKIYGISDARSYDGTINSVQGAGVWNSDAWVSEGSTMDDNGGGHPDQGGNYHYHANPVALYSDPSATHSPIIGFAFDGYPIYGPFAYGNPLDSTSAIKRMTSGYQLRNITKRNILPDGTNATPPGPDVNTTFPLGTYIEDYEYILGDLDEYNGRFCYTPDYPLGTYAYFIATDSVGNPAFPYVLGLQYYGKVSSADIGGTAGNSTIPSGVTCVNSTTALYEVSTEILEIFPNPATDMVYINNNTMFTNVKIYNAFGQLVSNTLLNSTHASISIDFLKKGVYFLCLENKSGDRKKQVIIKNQ